MKRLLIASLLSVAAAGCATHGGGGGTHAGGGPQGGGSHGGGPHGGGEHGGGAVALVGTEWKLERIGGHDSVGSKAALTVSREGRIGGNGSCNAMFGHAKLDGANITFEMIGSTKMACTDEDVMAQEHRYFDLLKRVVTWRIQDGRLYLTNHAHTDVLVFERD